MAKLLKLGPWMEERCVAPMAWVFAILSPVFFCATAQVSLAQGAAGPLDQWTLRHEFAPLLPPSENILHDVAYGTNLYVAVGEGGRIITTPDPDSISWSNQNSGTTNSLEAVTFANDTFIAVGSDGIILTSTNGIDWTYQQSGTTLGLSDVAFGNGTFVVLGGNGLNLTSSDGRSWIQRTGPAQATTVQGVTFGLGTFVAVGLNSLLTSSDGVTWTEQKIPSVNSFFFSKLAYGNGLFVAVGPTGIFTSPDTVNWTRQDSGVSSSPPPVFNDVTYFNGTFISVGGAINGAVSSSFIITSKDGIKWTSQASPTPSQLFAVTGSDGRLVALGGGFAGPVRLQDALLTSADGVQWRDRGAPLNLQGIVFGNDLFVAVGSNGTVLTSPDGRTWQAQELNTSVKFNDIAYNGRSYVAVGDAGTVAVSQNGTNWVLQSLSAKKDLNAVSSGNGTFVAVGGRYRPDSAGGGTGDSITLSSMNGMSWTTRQVEQDPLYGVVYGNGRFAAVGGSQPDLQLSSRTTSTSTNGINWLSQREIGPVFDRITFGNGLFVTLSPGAIYTSPDADKWAVHWIFWITSKTLNDIEYGNSVSVAVGEAGTLLSSSDGTTWVPRGTGSTRNLNGIAYGEGRFVAVGDFGTILQSGRLEAPTAPIIIQPAFVSGQFTVSFQAARGTTYFLEFKRTLAETSWQTLASVDGDDAVQSIADPALGEIRRFYRLRVE